MRLQVEDLSIWDCSEEDEQDKLSKEEIDLIKSEIADEFGEE